MVKNAITDMGNAWRRAIQASSEKLWDGSSKSIQHLTNLMKEGVMMDSSSDVQVNAGDLQNQFQIAMAAFLIPETWNRAPDGFHPVVIRVSFIFCRSNAANLI